MYNVHGISHLVIKLFLNKLCKVFKKRVVLKSGVVVEKNTYK